MSELRGVCAAGGLVVADDSFGTTFAPASAIEGLGVSFFRGATGEIFMRP
jgi:hypothetical protein